MSMSKVKQQVYLSILKMIMYSLVLFNLTKGLFGGFLHEDFLSDSFYLFLIMFLRSSMTAPTWNVGLKWTILISIPIESFMYGGGVRAVLIASISIVKFLFNYGFVLYWNPVLTKKDTLANRMIEITLSSVAISLFSPWILQTLLLQIVLSIHSFWIQTCVVHDVCDSGVMNDVKSAVSEIPSQVSTSRPPIEVWIVAYYAATQNMNILPQEIVTAYLTQSTPWQLRRLILKSVSIDPTRTQIKSLLAIAAQSSAAPIAQKQPTLMNCGPLALISDEPNEKILINEAIGALSRLHTSLGEKRFMSAFDRSSDSKAALDVINNGFK
jgi:hypothetical protein